MIREHTLAGADFEALATGLGDNETIRALRDGQFSKHLLQLRAILDDGTAAGLRGVLEPGLKLLAAAQQADQEAVGELLLHPPVGNWLAHCLRRLHVDHPDVTALSTDLGQLNAVAAAAAVSADTAFTIQVPSRDGCVMLPGLGRAVVTGLATGEPVTISSQPGQPVTVRGGDTRIELTGGPEQAAPGWLPLHRIAVGTGPQLCVCLDDLDPFRDCHGAPVSGPLHADAVARWQTLLAEAWSILCSGHPDYAQAIAAGMRSIIPLRTPADGHGISATSPDSFGSCLMSEPADAVTLAAGLVHEFQHAKLAALMDLLRLHKSDTGARYYAPWRDDPRPLGGLLHGIYAFLAVTDFWRVQRRVTPAGEADFAHFEFARWRSQTLLATQILQSSGKLTDLGTCLVTRITDRLHSWVEHVPDGPATAAWQVTADHQVNWRLRNLRPDQTRVQLIADAWQAGQPCPASSGPPARVRLGGLALNNNGRRDLLLLGQRDPVRCARLREQPAELAAVIPAASGADVAYVRGDLASAAQGYLRILQHEPDQLTAWAGLTLIRKHQVAGQPDCWADEPELVMALCRHLSKTGQPVADPQELADWLRPTRLAPSQEGRFDIELEPVQVLDQSHFRVLGAWIDH